MARKKASGNVETGSQAFGILLRLFREDRGFTQSDVAKRLNCSRSVVTRIESGNYQPAEDMIVTLDKIFDTKLFSKIATEINWHPVRSHPDWFQRRADLDAILTELREYQTVLIPGLLQTEDYASALYQREGTSSPEEIAVLVAARLDRQKRFMQPGGPLFSVLLDESCLYECMGEPCVMQRQLGHLLVAAQLPNVRIQLVPYSLNTERPNASMSLITLPTESWLYSESLTQGYLINDPAVFGQYARIYALLQADALNTQDTAAVISDAMKGLHNHAPSPQPDGGTLAQEQPQRLQRRKLHRGGPRIHLRKRPGA